VHLKSFTEKTNAGNQQLQYEHCLAERKMAIARTALETIANGETDPGVVRELARLPEQVLGVCGPAVFRTEVCMQDHSRLKSGRIILAPYLQFFFRIGTFMASKNANKRRQLDPVGFHTVINAMVLSVYLQNCKLFFVHSGPPSRVK